MWNEPDSGKTLVHIRNGKKVEVCLDSATMDGFEYFETGGFYYENMSFFDALYKGENPDGDLRSSLQSMEVAFCIACRKVEYCAAESAG